ncbi:MAG: flagellar biosynthesis protein FlhB [Nitrospirae bacterium]|nr:flagellar biosynthesis protein FlhB [Nitrospirota bacterium]MCL5237187.1 flagellar biosynthesis protein FlhB [Nitrospirota bacterium]
MAEEFDERTEQATPRRRQKAREKGDVPRSRDLTGLMPLWVVTLYLSFGGFMLTTLLSYLRAALRRGFEAPLSDTSFIEIFRADTFQIGMMMAPLFLLMLFLIAAVHFLQTGFLISPAPLSPDISKINPLEGIKKFISINTLFETVKGFFKVIVLGLILYFILKNEVLKLPLLVDMDIQSIMGFSFGQIKKLLIISATVLSVFAVADFAYQRWQFERNLRMTKQEVKEEYKEMEGDPRVKARIKSLQRDMARKRMMQEVPKADVVITNPTHFAVALKYDSAKMGAPTLVAKGANLIAGKIKEVARKSGVPVFEDKPLARTLYKMEIGQEIPEPLYKALATILANVYKLKKKTVMRNG